MTQETSASLDQTPSPQLIVHHIYVKGSGFEAARITPELIKAAQQGTVDFQAAANFSERGNEQYEAMLTLTVTAKHEGNFLWRVHCQQAGLYTLKGIDNDASRKQVLNGFCMNQLYPYASAYINYLVVQGGFPAVTLLPMDFNRIYQEQLAKDQAQVQPTHEKAEEVVH